MLSNESPVIVAMIAVTLRRFCVNARPTRLRSRMPAIDCCKIVQGGAMNAVEQRAFYTTREVTEMTGLSRDQVLEAVHAGMIRTLPEEKHRGQYLLDVPSVEEFIGAPADWEGLLFEADGRARPAA